MVKKILFIPLISLLFNSVQMLGMEAKDWEAEERARESEKMERVAETTSGPESYGKPMPKATRRTPRPMPKAAMQPLPQEKTPWYENKWSGVPLGLGALSLSGLALSGRQVGEIPARLTTGAVGLGLILSGLQSTFAPFKASTEKRFTAPWFKDYLYGALSRISGIGLTTLGSLGALLSLGEVKLSDY